MASYIDVVDTAKRIIENFPANDVIGVAKSKLMLGSLLVNGRENVLDNGKTVFCIACLVF